MLQVTENHTQSVEHFNLKLQIIKADQYVSDLTARSNEFLEEMNRYLKGTGKIYLYETNRGHIAVITFESKLHTSINTQNKTSRLHKSDLEHFLTYPQFRWITPKLTAFEIGFENIQ